MKKGTIVTLCILALVLLVFAWFAWQALRTESQQGLAENDAGTLFTSDAATLHYTDFAGTPANLDQHVGNVIVAHSWASWVPDSPDTLRLLAELQTRYAEQGVQVVAINRGEQPKTAQQFLDAHDITGLKIVADTDDRFFASIDGQAMPETIFYAADGSLVAHHRGSITGEQLLEYINVALAED